MAVRGRSFSVHFPSNPLSAIENMFSSSATPSIGPSTLPVAMTIAGSDNSAGAGAQADLKTMSALGVYGVTTITCVVAEVPGKVSAIQAIDPKIVAEQIRLLFGAFPIASIKTGMLHSRAILDAVCDVLLECFAEGNKKPPLIVDPVMVAT